MTKICAGSAISKNTIDAHAAGVDRRVENDRPGSRAIDRFLRKRTVRRFVIEATGRLVKTDKADARMLAAFAAAFADLSATEPKSGFLNLNFFGNSVDGTKKRRFFNNIEIIQRSGKLQSIFM